jgi:hypothetical protein
MEATDVRMPGVLRAGLLILGVPQFAIGAWAIISPHGWFDTFPGAGHHWLPAYGAFNSHLAFDVGATFVAIGLILGLAALWLERRVVQLALIGYLAYAIPHFIYHLANDHDLGGGDQVANGITLGLTVLLALVLLSLTRRPAAPASVEPAAAE